MSDSTSSNVKIGCGGVPVIFLGATAYAYLAMPDSIEPTSRLVGAALIGAGTSIGSGVGVLVVGGLGALGGAVLGAAASQGDESGMGCGAVGIGCIGAVAGAALGIWGGYSLSHMLVMPLIEDDRAASIQHMSHEQLAAITGPALQLDARGIPVIERSAVPANG